jgi:hypothetical protein
MAHIDARPTFRFTASLWEADGTASWVFVTLPPDDSEEIRDLVPDRPGFGSVRVRVQLGATTWKTSVFPDSKQGCYVLPVKRKVRDAAGVDVGDLVEIDLEVIDD